ncbi:AraC family transcriptional regulator [Acaryochloris marina]|uniref:AraC family transcriptional regulator n=1 Tax=Acaryochloris marina TaxID=155978 RepID=UPI0021C29139|nr:AraC family transcriptional regulator [Acaryochloris marina]BDM83775.1 hypothetical protein AM10699_66360 [Acaryochloris marina MBIC10699]
MYAEAIANFLAAHLLMIYTTKNFSLKSYSGGLSPYKLKQVLEYIDTYLSSNLSIKTLAAISGLSPYYFCRLFKQSKGYSPHQYILHKRVERAKDFLKNSNLSIADIALACGFSNQSHFNRYFKRIVGVTPKQFTIK